MAIGGEFHWFLGRYNWIYAHIVLFHPGGPVSCPKNCIIDPLSSHKAQPTQCNNKQMITIDYNWTITSLGPRNNNVWCSFCGRQISVIHTCTCLKWCSRCIKPYNNQQMRVRTYCCCTPGRWLCNKHYLVQYKDCVSTQFIGNWYQLINFPDSGDLPLWIFNE